MAMPYLNGDGISVNSATLAHEDTWFKQIGAELLVELLSPTAGKFAMCKGNVEEIADVELDCTGCSASNIKRFSSFTSSLMH